MAAYRVESVGILAATHPLYRELDDEEHRRRNEERRERMRSSAAREAGEAPGDGRAEEEHRDTWSGDAGDSDRRGGDAGNEPPQIDDWA